MFEIGTEGAKVPGRNGYGDIGKKLTLRANFFKINTAFELNRPDAEQTWYRYDVEVSPEPSRQKRRRLFSKIATHPKFKDVLWATDYAKIIVTTKKLDLGNGEWKERIPIPAETVGSQPASQGEAPDFVREARERNTVTFRVTATGSFNIRHIIEYLRSTRPGAEYAGAADIIQLFNIIMCKPPNGAANVSALGGNQFFPHEGHPGAKSFDLGGGLEALRGYYSSVRPATGRLLLNLNVTRAVFYKPLRLLDLMSEFRGSNEQREAFLRMVKVKVQYPKNDPKQPEMTKIKTIVGFAKDNPPSVRGVKRFGNANEVKFPYKEESAANAPVRQITVAEYFRNVRGITLQRPDLAVLNCGTRADPQYVPVELCTVIPGQRYKRLLSGEGTAEMIKFAARAPNINAMSIAGTPKSPGNGLRLLRLRDPAGETDPQGLSVKPWGFSVDPNMITVPGLVLQKPRIEYKTRTEEPRSGSWNFAKQKFVKPGRIGTWQVLVINRRGHRGNALNENPQGEMKAPEALFRLLEESLVSYGLTLGQRLRTQSILLENLTIDNRASNNRLVEQAFHKAKDANVRFLFVVLPEVDRWLYARIKYYGDIKFGIQSICAVGSKMQKPQGQGRCHSQ
jgi:eukaryotic translation initiation factor 2C